MKKIVIIGGGFAGLNVAKNINSKQYQVTLVDKNNYNFFQPLLYQVGSGFLDPSAISYPFRKMLRNKHNVRFKMGEVVQVKPEQNTVIFTTGKLEYDYLVFATGTKSNYFGLNNVKNNAIPMKTINDALGMRNHFLNQLEIATTITSDKENLKKKLTIVVAGGGPTGVEISGVLAEMRTSIFKKDYPEFNSTGPGIEIYLVDGASQVLTPMSKSSQRDAYKALEKLGVKIILNAQVTDYITQVSYFKIHLST